MLIVSFCVIKPKMGKRQRTQTSPRHPRSKKKQRTRGPRRVPWENIEKREQLAASLPVTNNGHVEPAVRLPHSWMNCRASGNEHPIPVVRQTFHAATPESLTVLCGFKMRLRPSPDTKRLLHRMFDHFDRAYNQAVYLYEERSQRANAIALRPLIFGGASCDPVKSRKINRKFNPEIFGTDCPYDLKMGGVREFCHRVASTRAAAAAIAQQKKRRPHKFHMSPRDMNSVRRQFAVPRNGGNPSVKFDVNGVAFWKRVIPGPIPFWKRGKPLLRELSRLNAYLPTAGMSKNTCTLLYDRGRYFIIIPRPKPVAPPKTACGDLVRVKSVDPGVRTFQTTYDFNGNYGEYGVSGPTLGQDVCMTSVGEGNVQSFIRRSKRIDRLRSHIDCIPHDVRGQTRRQMHGKRKALRKKMRVEQHRIEDMRRDAHHRVAKNMCSDADHIIIPRFKVSEMTRKSGRKIPKSVVRGMLALGHYQFRQILKHTGMMTGTAIHEKTEPYTSKGCGRCLYVHETLGGSPEFRCPRAGCGYRHHRDQHGSRMIGILNVDCVGEYDPNGRIMNPPV